METKTDLSAKIRVNQKMIGRLMNLFNKSSFTIVRWIDDKDIRLATPGAVQIIQEETEFSKKEILEEFSNRRVA